MSAKFSAILTSFFIIQTTAICFLVLKGIKNIKLTRRLNMQMFEMKKEINAIIKFINR